MDNLWVAVAVKDTSVKIYRLSDYTLNHTYSFSSNKPYRVRFSRDGKYLGISYEATHIIILNATYPFTHIRNIS